MIVSFDPTTYTVTEGDDEFVLLRLVRSGVNLDRETVVTVNPVPGTADGVFSVFLDSLLFSVSVSNTAPSDFTSTPITVTFMSGQTAATTEVPIRDDSDVENTENFSATLSSTDTNVMLGVDAANISILDNDGKELETMYADFIIPFPLP